MNLHHMLTIHGKKHDRSLVGRARLFALRPTIRMLGNGEAVAQPTWLLGFFE